MAVLAERDKTSLIDQILSLEWEMFHSVNGEGPKAACQLDREKFRKMRSCQYRTWSTSHLASWLSDLRSAANQGRNLAAEKYIRMMEDTHPEEYAAISSVLPTQDERTTALVDEIVAMHMRWKEELDREFPALAGNGRKLRRSDSLASGEASFETYLRSELLTCSGNTIVIYHADLLQKLQEGGNEARENLLNQAREAGFENLESANSHLAGQTVHG